MNIITQNHLILERLIPDILKVDFVRGQNFCFEIFCKKKYKNFTKNHLICVKHEEKKVKQVKMHNFLVCARFFFAKSEIFCAVARP